MKYFLLLYKLIFLRRLIRSLEDRHSVIPACLVQLRLQAFLQKEHCLLTIFVDKNSRQTKCLLRGKLYYNLFDCHTIIPLSMPRQNHFCFFGLVVVHLSGFIRFRLAVKVVVAGYTPALDLQRTVIYPVFFQHLFNSLLCCLNLAHGLVVYQYVG